MLFRLIWVGSHKVRADELQPYRGTLGGNYTLSLHVPPYPHPTILTQFLFWPGIWSLFCFFFLNPLFIICFIFFDFTRLCSLSFSVIIGRTLSLFISLPVSRWVRVSLSCIRPSIRSCICLSVCPSVRQGARGMWEGCGDPSLPAWLVVLSQSLRRSAHLCEARRVRARAHANSAFLCLFDLGQNVSDLSLGQLGDRAELRRWAA